MSCRETRVVEGRECDEIFSEIVTVLLCSILAGKEQNNTRETVQIPVKSNQKILKEGG
jgi:hypothetical protein